MITGPIYWNGLKFPSQNGLPVSITYDAFKSCCCGCITGWIETAIWERYLAAYPSSWYQKRDICFTLGLLRYWINDLIPKFINHVDGPLKTDRSDFLTFTTERFAEIADLSIDEYGKVLIESEEDAISALLNLQWTCPVVEDRFNYNWGAADHPFILVPGEYGRKGASGGYFHDWDKAKADQNANWNNASWRDFSEEDPDSYRYLGGAYSYDGEYEIRGYRGGYYNTGGTYQIQLGLRADRPPYTCTIYLKGARSPISIFQEHFHDFDNLGLVLGEYIALNNYEVTVDNTLTDYIGDTDNPCKHQAFESTGGWAATAKVLCKWHFTERT